MGGKDFLRSLAHFIFRIRQFNNRCIKQFASGVRNKKILELGSGKKHRGRYYYSAKQFFDRSNEFIRSDVVKEYGHEIIDITKLDSKNEFDIILCMNVLEHVFDFHTAVENLHNAVKPNGKVIVFVPGFYPLHDEPADYWRFTEHSLRRLLKDFSKVRIKYSGIRQYPFAYYVEATK